MMRRAGFSLVEMIVALGLLVLLVGALGLFISELRVRRTALLDLTNDLHAGSLIISRLEHELTTAVAGHPSAGAGVVGDSARLTILARGVAPAAAPDGFADLQSTSFTWNEATAEAAVTRSIPGGGPAVEEIVSGRVERVRLRYHDGRAWRDSFDSSQAGGLPVAVEIALWFPAPGRPVRPAAPPPDDPDRPGVGPATGGAPMTLEDLIDASMPAEERMWGPPDRLRIIAPPDASVSTREAGA